jgi:hypothetical protein
MFIISPEDGGSMFLRNVGMYLQIYTALQPRSPSSKVSSRIYFGLEDYTLHVHFMTGLFIRVTNMIPTLVAR